MLTGPGQVRAEHHQRVYPHMQQWTPFWDQASENGVWFWQWKQMQYAEEKEYFRSSKSMNQFAIFEYYKTGVVNWSHHCHSMVSLIIHQDLRQKPEKHPKTSSEKHNRNVILNKDNSE